MNSKLRLISIFIFCIYSLITKNYFALCGWVYALACELENLVNKK